MGFDSTIRLRQLNQAEISGFISQICSGILANSATFVAATGKLTGSFYPRTGNPSNFSPSGAFASQIDIDSAITQENILIANTYYPKSNPSGFGSGISGTSAVNVVHTTGNEVISGSKTFTNPLQVLNQITISGNPVITGTGSLYPNNNPSGYISNIDPANAFRVSSGQFQIWDVGYYGWMSINFISGQMITTGPIYDYVSFITPNTDYRFISGQFQIWDLGYLNWVSPIVTHGMLATNTGTSDSAPFNLNYVPNITTGSDYRFISGQFQLWDTFYSGWTPVSSISGQLYCGALVPDAGETDSNFVSIVSLSNNYRFLNQQFQIWDIGYSNWVAMISISGQLGTSIPIP